MGKFIRSFKTKEEYDEFLKENSKSDVPVLLYSPEAKVKFGSSLVLKDPFIRLKVNVTSVNDDVPIINSSSLYAVLGVTVDGNKRMLRGNAVRFRKRGEHTVTIFLKDDSLYKGLSFKGCDCIVGFEFIKDVEKINRGMFEKCVNITSVKIPKSVKIIDSSAFYGCKSLTSVTFNDCVEVIADEAFYQTGLSGIITIPASVKSIGSYAFNKCEDITSVEFMSEELPEIGKRAFIEKLEINYPEEFED